MHHFIKLFVWIFYMIVLCDNHVLQWWVQFDNELSWLFIDRFSATRYMNVKRMGITEILRRIWLFSANKIRVLNLVVNNNSSSNQLIIAAHNCHKYVQSIWLVRKLFDHMFYFLFFGLNQIFLTLLGKPRLSGF